jgi:hypothetical protein
MPALACVRDEAPAEVWALSEDASAPQPARHVVDCLRTLEERGVTLVTFAHESPTPRAADGPFDEFEPFSAGRIDYLRAIHA